MVHNINRKSKINDLNIINNTNVPTPAEEGSVADRRIVPERRDEPVKAAKKSAPTKKASGLERRRGPGRRRRDHIRSAEEGEMSTEQFLFIMAIDAFKRVNNKTFPTWTDVLEIVRRLGYRKVQSSQINLPNTEDWLERADTPALVERYSGIVDNYEEDDEVMTDDFIAAYDKLDALQAKDKTAIFDCPVDDPDELTAIDELDDLDDLDELDQLIEEDEKFEDAA